MEWTREGRCRIRRQCQGQERIILSQTNSLLANSPLDTFLLLVSRTLPLNIVTSCVCRFGSQTVNLNLVAAAKSPGPGSYKVKSMFGNEGVKSTIVGRRPATAPGAGCNAPGPGAYSSVDGLHKGPAYKIGTEQKCKLEKEAVHVPGPGAYNPAHERASCRPSSPHWRLGTEKRGYTSLTERNPGPGSYEQKPKIGEGPKYAIRPKTAVILRNGMPGPGQYNPLAGSVKLRPPSAVMGRQSRDAEFVAQTKGMPGPGSYMQSRALTARPAYTFGHEKKLHSSNDVPGPGTYRVPCTFANPPTFLLPGKSTEFAYV